MLDLSRNLLVSCKTASSCTTHVFIILAKFVEIGSEFSLVCGIGPVCVTSQVCGTGPV